MHPLFSSARKLLIALSTWLVVIASFILLQKSQINAPWLNLTILSAPPLFLLFFILLSNYYIARAIKLSNSTLYLPVFKHVAAAGLVNAFWLQLSMIYSEALRQAKAYKAITDRYGCKYLKGYQSYLAHNQGCSGIKKIIASSVDKKRHVLPHKIIRNMANNSPYSYKALNKSGGASKFLKHWDIKWRNTKTGLIKG